MNKRYTTAKSCRAHRRTATRCATTNDAKLPRAGAGECELTMRNLSALFGHEEVSLLQRKSRYELPHIRAFRELAVTAMAKG